jgi:hypothetical protein
MKHKKNNTQKVVLAKSLRVWKSIVNAFNLESFAQIIVSVQTAKTMKSLLREELWLRIKQLPLQ